MKAEISDVHCRDPPILKEDAHHLWCLPQVAGFRRVRVHIEGIAKGDLIEVLQSGMHESEQ